MKTALTIDILDVISRKPLARLHHLQNGRHNGPDRRGGTNSMSAIGSSSRNPMDEEFYCC